MTNVDKTKPLPNTPNRGAPVKYNFADLTESGDSIPFEVPFNKTPQQLMSQIISSFAKRNFDFKITCRREKEGNKYFVRVWRI